MPGMARASVTCMKAQEQESSGVPVTDNRGFTIDDALDAIGFGRFQWALLILSGIGFCTAHGCKLRI